MVAEQAPEGVRPLGVRVHQDVERDVELAVDAPDGRHAG